MTARALAALALAATLPAVAAAAEWGTIVPGQSTIESVRARYGTPTATVQEKIEGYDGQKWSYEGSQAPVGMQRLVVDFGLLTPAGYRGDLVRSFRLEPNPGIFERRAVVQGWGIPDRVGRDGEREVFFYEEGLIVYFDPGGENAQAMLFVSPQPAPGGAAPPQR